MFDDVNFANHMYTKISDLKLNKSISDNEEKIKYNEINFSRMEEDTKIKTGSRNADFDYLYYEENNSKKSKKPKKKNKVKKVEKKEETDTNKEIRFYIYLFILFYFLNSYFVINLINSYRIQYYLSLAIRSSLFLIFYYIIKRFS
jgi:hypothetical protein